MANYYAYARSNHFKVKDLRAFEAFCNRWNLEKIENDKGQVGFLANAEDGLTTDQYYDPATGDAVEASFERELASQLKAGEIAVVMQIGWEKLRYLTGWSWAVNQEGKVVGCDIAEIYKRAKILKPKGEVTRCEY